MRRILFTAISFVLLAFAPAWAQAPTGDITGTVNDASGAAVANAVVTLTNPAIGFQRTVSTNDSGIYSLPSLTPGNYTLKVEIKGFKTEERKDIELQVGQVARLDFSMQVGNVSDTIEVTAGAPVLDTETTAVGTVIENRRIVELPLNGRNYLQLVSLTPGATTNGPASSQGQQRMGGARNAFALNVSGQRVHYNHYSLDGIENTDPNFNTYLFLPSIDALQEFKVESSVFGPEYGRGIAQVNVTTKSGTNLIHGTLFEFLRNADLDAKNFFDKGSQPIPPFKRNQFGGTVSGPIWIPKVFDGRNKLFYLFDYEGLRQRKAVTSVSTFPFASDRAGDFSSSSVLIYDPATRKIGPDGKVTATPFAGNIIPANRIAPTSAKALAFFPLPNNITNGYVGDYLSNEGSLADSDQETGRIDWVQTANSTFQFRYSHGVDDAYSPQAVPTQGYFNHVVVHQGMLGHILVLGATKVNEFKFGISRLEGANSPLRAFKEDVVSALGITGVAQKFPAYYGIPDFNLNNFTGVGDCSDCPFVNYDTIFQWTDNFSWTLGKHALKFGIDARRTRFNQIGAVVARGRFTFSGNFSAAPGTAPAPQNAVADFLLGNMATSEGQVGAPIANFRNYAINPYFADQWKVTPKLTVNYGVRYEFEPPYLDTHDAIVNIDFHWDNSIFPTYVRAGTGDPYAGYPPFRLPASVPFVRDGRFGRRAYKTDATNIAPRVGVAYSATPKTVFRAGAGIYYVRDIGNGVFDVVRNAPFTIRRSENADTAIPNLSWGTPFTQLGAPSFILANQYGEPTSYVAQWSGGIQRQLGSNTSLEVDYLGSAGVHLRRIQLYNTAPPGPPGNSQLRRPFPTFGGDVQLVNASAHSTYHALQARFQQRFSHGFTVLSAFSYGKSIDNGSGIRTTDGDSLSPSNNYNLKGERGLSAFDFRRRSTTSFLYELPVGRGKALLGNTNAFANAMFGGWQLGGILTFQDGFPNTIYCSSGGTFQNNSTSCYADAVGISPELSSDQRNPQHWFNTAAFVDRVGYDPKTYVPRYGDSGRNTVIGPGIEVFDFSTAKNFHFTETRGLEFRAEFFNLPNHPNFGQPGNTVKTPNFGKITGTRIDSRQIQFGLKLNF